jgi:hypothetical protein
MYSSWYVTMALRIVTVLWGFLVVVQNPVVRFTRGEIRELSRIVHH